MQHVWIDTLKQKIYGKYVTITLIISVFHLFSQTLKYKYSNLVTEAAANKKVRKSDCYRWIHYHESGKEHRPYRTKHQDSYLLGGPPCPLPLPGPGEGPLAFPGGPLRGPGARVTGALGLEAARDTSFCRLTPLAAAPGFILGDLLPFSTTTSETMNRKHKE